MKLGDYIFTWSPDRMTIPEEKKLVAAAATIEGSALFQWEALLQGARVELHWEWMKEAQYEALREIYLSTDEINWNPGAGIIFTIVPADLEGEYFETALHEAPYRRNVRLVLDIRGTTTTSTSTTSTTTT